jgi:hypothetical protein
MENRAPNSLPDAPSASAQTEALRTAAIEVRSPLRAGTTATQGAGIQGFQPPTGYRWSHISFAAFETRTPVQKDPSDFFDKYLYPSLLRRNLNYHPSTSSSLMGRTTYAASRIFISRDSSGRGRLNTSYFLGALSAAVVHAAYRPYWNRPVSTPFSNLGSTIGNDAGMNLLHEFGPGLQQLMKSHAPKFVSRIEERIGHN